MGDQVMCVDGSRRARQRTNRSREPGLVKQLGAPLYRGDSIGDRLAEPGQHEGQHRWRYRSLRKNPSITIDNHRPIGANGRHGQAETACRR
jgi:hypothetical protein